MSSKWVLLVVVVSVALGCGGKPASAPPATPAVIPAGEIGSPMPEFVLEGLRGEPISSAEWKGKVVLVDFWATWCEPCKKEMPGYQKLLDRYKDRGFAVIGLKFDTMADTEDPLKFAKKIGIHYPLAIASDELKQKFGGIEGLPTTMLYDRQGMLQKKVIGFEYTEVFEKELQNLLCDGCD